MRARLSTRVQRTVRSGLVAMNGIRISYDLVQHTKLHLELQQRIPPKAFIRELDLVGGGWSGGQSDN